MYSLSNNHRNKTGRRISALLCFAFLCSGFLVSCAEKPITRSTFVLGTHVTITVFKGGSAKAIRAAFEQAVRIEKMMSTSRKDYKRTELLAINTQSEQYAKAQPQRNKRMKKHYTVSSEIATVLAASLHISQETQGAFDVTIEPLIRLWGFGDTRQRVPSERDIVAALQRVDWKTVEVTSENTIALGIGQSIDVGGIAKGYATDLAASTLKEHGVTHALIDFGGNIRTVGERKLNGDMWRIGIQAPFESMGSIVGTVLVGETSVVSSGVYERFFEQDGKRYFHIIDSTRGYPASNGLLSVMIITKDGMRADGFSTGVFVLGVQRGMALVERTKGMEAVFIDEKKTVHVTSGLVDSFEFESDEYRFAPALYK